VASRIAAAVLALLAVSGCGSQPRATHRGATAARSASRVAVVAKRTFTIGYSVQHRSIEAVEIGDPRQPRRMLVVGCIHGNEPAGIAVARRLISLAPPPNTTLWVIPNLNPDGVTAHTRHNARGVDLNRNFPWHWRPLDVPGELQYSGPGPLSEPESRAAARLILRVRPQITVWFHQPETLVDLSGGDPRIERRFARLVGLPVRKLTRYPGSAVSWGNAQLRGSTAFVVELPPGRLQPTVVTRYADAALALARELAARPNQTG
jgi:murein peptide amidase A